MGGQVPVEGRGDQGGRGLREYGEVAGVLGFEGGLLPEFLFEEGARPVSAAPWCTGRDRAPKTERNAAERAVMTFSSKPWRLSPTSLQRRGRAGSPSDTM